MQSTAGTREDELAARVASTVRTQLLREEWREMDDADAGGRFRRSRLEPSPELVESPEVTVHVDGGCPYPVVKRQRVQW